MKFRFDAISFFIGMAAATLVWWVLTLARPLLERWLELIRNKRKEGAQKSSSGLKDAYLRAVIKQTQNMHLAASLFSLDEIVEIPRLLAPPVIHEPNGAHSHQDIVEQTLPYLINYPELGAYYKAPTLSISQALSGDMHIAIIGQPGTGKTTALAYLAAQVAKSSPTVSELKGYIPFLIHVADLGLPLNNPQKPEDFLAPLIEKTTQLMGLFDAARIPRFLEYTFTNGLVLLLVDGIDELSQSGVQEVNAYLRVILRQYPMTRVVLTGSPEYLDGILSLGFAPLAIMPWSAEQQLHFLSNWSTLWQKYVVAESWTQRTIVPVDTLLLNRWLSTENFSLTPLEYTLKIWGAYAGDIHSTNPIDTIEAHIRRLTPNNVPIDALSMLGMQASANETPIFDGRRAREWIKSFEAEFSPEIPEIDSPLRQTDVILANVEPEQIEFKEHVSEAVMDPKKTSKPSTPHARTSMISTLTSTGLLISHSGNKLRFSNPVFLGYLAGKGLAKNSTTGTALLNQPDWSGQTTSLRYMTAFGDATEIVNTLLKKEDPVLMRPTLKAARMIGIARQLPEATWHGTVIASLVEILRKDDLPIGLRGEAMMALALSHDVNIAVLFRQLLHAPSNELQQLAVLGAGMARDSKSIETLKGLVANSLDSVRRAACLALVEIGTPQALEAVAVYLLRGDEQLRIYAAEALANQPIEGQEALREGINSEDILVRRAIVYGLSRVNEPWTTELLDKTQLNDEQWAVRNVAIEFLKARQNPDLRIPQKNTPPHATPWVIEFASKYGMGVSPGQPATDLFLLALKDSNREYLQPALNYLRYSPNENVIAALYQHLYGTDPDAKEAVFQVLLFMALGGASLPEPRQFGLG